MEFGQITYKNIRLSEGTPVNAVNATGILTFTGVVADGQTVTIGSDVYEFDTAETSTITEGNIRVDVNVAQTAVAAVTALVAAITANEDSLVSAVDGEGDTVVVTAEVAGISGNDIVTSTTCTNASWGDTELAGGVDGTVVPNDGFWFKDNSYIYYTTTANSVSDKNWRRVALGSAY